MADTPELRAAYAEGMGRLVEASTRLHQNRDVYDLLVALTNTSVALAGATATVPP